MVIEDRNRSMEGWLRRSSTRAGAALRILVALALAVLGTTAGLAALSEGDDSSEEPSAEKEWIEIKGGLMYQELKIGDGNEAGRGSFVQVRYVGTLDDGSIFDENTGNGFAFKMGEGQVIRGWELGVAGMKVGGKRRLKVPPKMGYGSAGVKGRIPKKATLTFEIELVSANR